jgi:hypothetical protein
MRQSIARAVGTTHRQNAADLRRGASSLRTRLAQDSSRAASKIYSTLLPSRIARNLLKTNNPAALYPSQIQEAFFSRKRRAHRSRSSSAQSTSRGFLTRKELECGHRSESHKSEGGFSWQLILL